MTVIARTIERGIEPLVNGRFNAPVATEGEAEDGHIFSIRGLKVGPRVSMLYGHRSTWQIPTLGSWTNPVKRMKDGVRVLRMDGHLEQDGDDVFGDVRRNMWLMIERGHLTGISARVLPTSVMARTSLSKDHAAFVDAGKTDRGDVRRNGYFVESGDLLENSIVWAGKDPETTIGRECESKNEHVQTFFRVMAGSAADTEDGSCDLGVAFRALRESLDGVKDLGVGDTELAEYLASSDPREYENYTFTAPDGSLQRARIPRDVYDALIGESLSVYRGATALYADLERERQVTPQAQVNETTPAATVAPPDFAALADRMARAASEAGTQAVEAAIAARLGRASNG